ncbi:MAG: PQQ-dependent sugar dehydrogenase [marine benthic group bacterium]|nr:PQQ-dependent sugar dehydrogenase [Gemmatimonadota bacterium]
MSLRTPGLTGWPDCPTRWGFVVCLATLLSAEGAASQHARPECDPDNGGITLPEEFCALVVADGLGRIRHLAVQPDGDIFVAIRGRRNQTGGVLALRDTTGDGRADVRLRLVEDRGGTGIALSGDTLFYGRDDAVLRFSLNPFDLGSAAAPDTLVQGLPSDGGHAAKSIAVTPGGDLFVNIGSASNACQEQDRRRESPGRDPCPELPVRAGIWRFSSTETGQGPDDGERWASGLRNTVALAIRSKDGGLYGVVHGRDQLHGSWPERFSEQQNAEAPSEEFVRIVRGGRYSWPECYHDPETDRLVLAPEYGGDGVETGRCATRDRPIAAYPAHWAPNALLFYEGDAFPERYQGGAFIAFHGSWNRAPLPQGGYNIVFQPFDANGPTGAWETFADGFAGVDRSPGGARHRPTGLAVGPDGSLFISDDSGGRIWRVLHAP